MSEASERVAVPCPSCSPHADTVHEVLKDGGQTTVRCTDCEHVHKTRIEEEKTVTRDVVVSQGDESFTADADIPAGETLSVGEEFVLDTEEALMVCRITSLELGDDQRADEATAEDVQTIWTRAVGNVSVNVTIHPKDGKRDETRSLTIDVPGDYTFTVGESESFNDEEFTVEGIHVRDDASGYPFDKFDQDGDDLVAKDIKRLYARDETTTAWSAW